MAKVRSTKKTKGKKATKKAAKAVRKGVRKVTKKAAGSKRVTKKMATKKAGPKMARATSGIKLVKNMNPSISLGQDVPDFSAEATGQKTISLNGLRGRNVVLYFYPKDATPGCTLEGHDFTKLHDQFKDANTEVYGVSRDTIDSHEKFKTDECYSIDLLSDPEEQLCNTFGVIKPKNMYGKQVIGIERSTFVIGADGRLVKEWRGVSVPGHAEEVLQFVKTLQTQDNN